MSTRYSAFAPAAFGERAHAGNREFPPVNREHGARWTGSGQRALDPADSSGSTFGNSAPSVKRPCNNLRTAQPADALEIADSFTLRVTARDLMSDCAATLRPEDSIERAARLMGETQIGSLPVIDDTGRLIGIITERDITVRLIALGASIPHAQVGDCMTSEAFACSADCSLESCVSAMSWHQLRRIPIVDEEHRVIGIISQRELACYVCEHSERAAHGAMADLLWALAY